MEWQLWTDVPPACFSAPCRHAHLSLLPSCFVLQGAESDLPAGAHLRFCSLAFLLRSFRNQEKQTFPISSFLKEVKKKGVEEGRREIPCKNWQKTLQENEFDRFVQFWISIFLFPESVRKAEALPQRRIKSLRPLSEKRGDTHHFLSKLSEEYPCRQNQDTNHYLQIIGGKSN